MPTISSIMLPNGVTYDFAVRAENRERVQIITEYTGEETTFNALEMTQVTGTSDYQFSINAPDNSTIASYETGDDYFAILKKTYFFGDEVHTSCPLYPDGGISFDNSTALPQQTDGNAYNVLVFDAFSAGGRVKFAYATYSATASRIVSRNASGDVCARYYNTSCSAENIASYTSPHVAFIDASGYVRKTSLANLRAWIALVPSATKATYATLNYLGNVTSSNSKSFTVNSNATEFVISANFSGSGTSKLFTSSIPRNLLNATAKEIWLSGGDAGGAAYARCLCSISLNTSAGTITVKGVAANDGATNTLSGTTFYVYQR